MTFIAVDPGGPLIGWAVFIYNRLRACGLHRVKDKDTFSRAQAHRRFIEELKVQWCATDVVSEAMWYRGRKSGIPPQDLIDVNLVAGAVANEWVLPHQWKGLVSKELHQPRIWAALEESEKVLLRTVTPESLRHNCVDAVGIGLFRARRLVPCPLPTISQARARTKRTSAAQPSRTSSQRTKRSAAKRKNPSSGLNLRRALSALASARSTKA